MNWLYFAWERRTSILIGLTLSLLAFNIGRTVGYLRGETGGVQKVKTTMAEQSIQIRGEQNEIRNHRPDVDVLVKRLRQGGF